MFEDFQFAIYELTLAAGPRGLSLPRYKGSTLRGGFGHVFRRLTCVERTKQCNKCLLSASCPYAVVFESAPLPGTAVLKNYQDIPRPFVIEPPLEEKTDYAPGDTLTFRLVLVGQAMQLLPYFILTFKELGQVGLGRGRCPYELTRVAFMDPRDGARQTVYDSAANSVQQRGRAVTLAELCAASHPLGDTVRLAFLTMTRIKHDAALVSDMPFHVLIRSLLRRISTMYYFYHGMKDAAVDYKGIVAAAERVSTVHADLRLVDWERYSQRQNARMHMPGLVGEVVYQGDIQAFWPILLLGQVVHVGKGCVFGLGQYTIKGG